MSDSPEMYRGRIIYVFSSKNKGTKEKQKLKKKG